MSLLSFKNFLVESKNLHLEHLEDIMFLEGSSGINDAIEFLKAISEMLSSKTKGRYDLTVKWDGAPAVFAGINPENGKFFVGTKAIFNKTPKINYTHADIDKNHKGGLVTRLKVALSELSKLGIKGILQGDMMFMKKDLSNKTIGGENYVTFTPNTITYTVPVDSKLAREIQGAKMGIVWHTKYSGKTMRNLKASFTPRISSLRKTRDVWYDDASFKDTAGTSTMTNEEQKDLKKLIDIIEDKKGIGDYVDDLITDTFIISELKIYINSKVRQGANLSSAGDYINYMDSKMQDDVDSMKSEKGKEKKANLRAEVLNKLKKDKGNIQKVFDLHNAITNAKNKIVMKLNSVKDIGTFIRTDDGFKVTAPEGFVAVDRLGKNSFKLVDRLEFSQQNFNAAKNWIKG